jgi:hypothetical protein
MKKLLAGLLMLGCFSVFSSEIRVTKYDRGWSLSHTQGTNLVSMRKNILLSYEGTFRTRLIVLADLNKLCAGLGAQESESQNEEFSGDIDSFETHIKSVDSNSPVVIEDQNLVYGKHRCQIDIELIIN